MAYKIKNKNKGRPKAHFKVRTIKGFTPRGFEFHEIEGKKIIFKRKKKE